MIEKLKDEFIKRDEKLKEILNLYKGDLFLNCADKQAIRYENGKFRFLSIGGSRYCWDLKSFDNIKDCVDFALKNIVYKTNEQIDNEFEKIFNKISK